MHLLEPCRIYISTEADNRVDRAKRTHCGLWSARLAFICPPHYGRWGKFREAVEANSLFASQKLASMSRRLRDPFHWCLTIELRCAVRRHLE